MSKTTTKGTKFVTTVLANLNKTEKELQKESVESFVEDATIECNTQISHLETAVLPKAKLDLTRAENKLTKAKKAYDVVRFSTATNFEQYVQNREKAEDEIESAQNSVNSVKEEITEAERQLAKYQEVLADLTA
jgi:hypothetical protein